MQNKLICKSYNQINVCITALVIQHFRYEHYSQYCHVPSCSKITVDEFHRHLAVDNLDDVHGDARRSRCGTSH